MRRHDGFYLRFELGIGGLFGSRTEIDDNFYDEEIHLDGSISGLAQVGSLMLGGTVAPGLVLGGGTWGVNAPAIGYSGDVRRSGFQVTDEVAEDQEVNLGFGSVSIIGPFVGWYPDPTGGLHGELALGLALATLGDFEDYGAVESRVSEYEGAGWGVVLGGGYDFWVSEQWSLGVYGRVSHARLGRSGRTNTLAAWTPALGVAATYH